MTTTNTALDFPGSGTARTIFGWVSDVPQQFWIGALIATALSALVLVPLGRRAARRLGEARAKGETAGQSPEEARRLRRDRQLMFASLTPAVLFWLAVLIGSGRGLTAFGRDTLGWHNGWDWLVPGTLDGVAVTFAVLAFRALAKGRNPDRARRIVWMATASSSFVNFFHEISKPGDSGSALGALYLGILSVMGMLILDEFLCQFEEGAGYVKREKPRFGLRWITLFPNTLCAWLAWTNYPPATGTEPSIPAAVQHLRSVRSTKTAERNERDAQRSTLPAWTRVAPWVRARKLQAMLERSTRSMEQRIAQISEEHRSATERLVAEHRSALDQITTEQSTERSALTRTAREQTERMEQSLRDAQSTIERLERERAAEAAQARALADQLRAAGEQQANVAELIQRHAQQMRDAERQRGELAVAIERAQGEARSARLASEQSADRADRAERGLREVEQQSAALIHQVQAATDRAEQAERAATERAEQIAALNRTAAERAATERADTSQRSGAGGARSAMKDREHLVILFDKLDPPVGGEGWSLRAVNRETNAGFGPNGRAKRLIDLAMQHATECDEAEHTGSCITLDWVTAAVSTATTTEN